MGDMQVLTKEEANYFKGNGRYWQGFKEWNSVLFDLYNEAEGKAEKTSAKNRIIDEIKKMEYPKGVTKELVAYVRSKY